MNYNVLGRTGLKVSEITFGAASFGGVYGKTSKEEMERTFSIALENGINYFDVAPSYGREGKAEERLGEIIQGKRDKIYLATKFGRFDHGIDTPEYEYDYSPERLFKEVDNSLKRLRTDYIDVYQLHDIVNCSSLDKLIEETIPAMEKLKKQGKIRFIGITCVNLEALKYVAERAPIDTILSFCRYNLIDQSLEGYFEEELKEKNIGLINASILYMGILTSTFKTLVQWNDNKKLNDLRETVKKAVALCGQNGTSLPEQAFLYGMKYSEPATTLVGMGRPSSIERNLALLKKQPNDELIKQLIAIFKNKVYEWGE